MKKHEAIITGTIYRYEEHLQNEIEIEKKVYNYPSPIETYSGSLKQFLHEALIETNPNTTVYFMAKVQAEYTKEPKEKIEFSLLDVSYMHWKNEEE